MSSRGELPCFPPDEAASRRRIRRYAVPGWMIERATERRLAGDWRGACAAANVDVTFDLPEIADRCGDDIAAALEDDLRHLAPDLLRWHLPRVLGGRSTLATDRTVVLARYRPKAPGERVKLTVAVLDPDLRADALRVSAARQVNQTGAWVDAPVSAATVQKLEDIILTRARDLRRAAVRG